MLTFLGFALLQKSKPKPVEFDTFKNKYKPNIELSLKPQQSKTDVISSFYMDEIFIISGFVAFGMVIWLLIRAEIEARKNLKK